LRFPQRPGGPEIFGISTPQSREWERWLKGLASLDLVQEEIERLKSSWAVDGSPAPDSLLAEVLTVDQTERLDLFDRFQLERVIEVCRQSRSMSEAGRSLFHASRSRKASSNDADRLRKYLARFSLDWAQVVGTDNERSAT
jgi:transcriptional regulatory protein RtcR